MSKLEKAVSEIVDEMRQMPDRGEVADYIPELARVDPKSFGLVVIDADGNVVAGGDGDMPFSIQSISKVFTLTLALGKIGDRLWERVGREPSGSAFNSIVQLEFERGIPRNPFINAGAIAVTDVILSGHQPREVLGEILRFMRFLADDPTRSSSTQAVAASEQRTGYRNVALANYMKSFGVLENPVDYTLGVYFHHCAIAMSCRQLAMAGASWRNVGRNPVDGPARGDGRAGAAHQRADADVRTLRRLGRIRLSRRPAGQERRRRRHPRYRAGQGLDRGVVAGTGCFREFAARPDRARALSKRMELVHLRGVRPPCGA